MSTTECDKAAEVLLSLLEGSPPVTEAQKALVARHVPVCRSCREDLFADLPPAVQSAIIKVGEKGQ